MENILTIAITGINRGLGNELVKNLCQRNNPIPKLILTSRDQTQGQKLLQQLQSQYANADLLYHQLDITDSKSITNFQNFLIQNSIKLDVLVNNAGVYYKNDLYSYSSAKNTINTNFTSTVNFTETIVSEIKENGKIIFLSSSLGKLSSQGKEIQQKLSNNITKDELFKLSDEFQQQVQQNNVQGWNKDSYYVSKCLLNAYVRFNGSSVLKSNNQQMFCVHPGWCRTEMGGNNATLSAEEGIVSTLKCIYDIQFQNTDNNLKFFNENGKIQEW